MSKIRVLITDDSLLFRSVLRNELSKDDEIEVVGLAVDPLDAARKIEILHPDVITLDVEMPKMSGIEFLKDLMKKAPQRVVLVSSLDINVFDALNAGAVDFVKKPNMSRKNELEEFYAELISKVKIANSAKLKNSLDHRRKHETKFINGKSAFSKMQKKPGEDKEISKVENFSSKKIIAIGASTGGTEATLTILKKFSSNMPPILVTQHMPAGFTKMYADRLDRICKMKVKEAKNGDRVNYGEILIAPGDFQMRLFKDTKGYYVSCKSGEKVSGHMPSVDVLLESVADVAGKNAIGIILTGMGKDGAESMSKLHKTGAYTIGQNEESCVVYGMPKVAYELGGIDVQADIEDISEIIIKAVNKN